MSHNDNLIKMLQILNNGNIDSAEIARTVDLSVEAVRYYLKFLRDEGFVQCTEMSGSSRSEEYSCWLENKGKAALGKKNLSGLLISEQQIDLVSQGINQEQAEILRASLMAFADDWNSPEMSLYDHYDAARANLEAR